MAIFIILLTFVLFAAGLAAYFIRGDRGEKEPIGALWLAFGFGMAGGLAAAVIENFVLPIKDLTPGSGAALLSILLASLGVGVIEEACKFVPLAIFLYPKRYFNEHTDGIIYFALAGLGFGLPENLLYTMQFGAKVGVGRLILTPFFHAATTAMVGYFLIRSKLQHRSLFSVGVALAAAMLLHGLYDFGLISQVSIWMMLSVAITFTMSALLFVLYAKATEQDRQAGLSAVGHNKFCRSCGQPNPDRNLYCTHCGRYA